MSKVRQHSLNEGKLIKTKKHAKLKSKEMRKFAKERGSYRKRKASQTGEQTLAKRAKERKEESSKTKSIGD